MRERLASRLQSVQHQQAHCEGEDGSWCRDSSQKGGKHESHFCVEGRAAVHYIGPNRHPACSTPSIDQASPQLRTPGAQKEPGKPPGGLDNSPGPGRGVPFIRRGRPGRPTRTTENRLARRSPTYRRHLAPDVSRLLGAAPTTVGNRPASTEKTRGRPRSIPECEHQRDWVAEREGFEPSVEFPLHTLSKRAPSTTRTSLRVSGINSLACLSITSKP